MSEELDYAKASLLILLDTERCLLEDINGDREEELAECRRKIEEQRLHVKSLMNR